jgi:Putative MetA-pathway of phenol degradation
LAFLAPLLLFQGGPPLLTDDPGTPGNGRWEINTAFTLERTRDAKLLEAPLLDINRGVGERVQLKLEIPWVVLDESGADARSGLGNTLLGVKWRFVDEEESGVSVSVYPQVEFQNPTSSEERGLVEPGSAWILPFQAQKDLGFLDVNGEVGYAFRDVGDDEWIGGLALGKALTPQLECVGEVHATADEGFHDGETLWNLGLRWAWSDACSLLLSTGRTFGGASGDEPHLLVYAGVQLRL